MKNKNKSVRMEGIKFYHTHKITKIGKQRLKKQKKKKTHGNRYKALCCYGLENT